MSLRAIKKRDNQLNTIVGARPTLFKKSTTSPQQRKYPATINNTAASSCSTTAFKAPSTLSSLHSLQQQRFLLGRRTQSSPELRHSTYTDTPERFAHLVRTKSESDVSICLENTYDNSVGGPRSAGGLIGAKSEVCLQSISSHSYQTANSPTKQQQNHTTQQHSATSQTRSPVTNDIMLSGARSHRDLTQSAYTAGAYGDVRDIGVSPVRRRMSECSLNSSPSYSQRTSAMSGSAITLASSNNAAAPVDPNAVVRVPIIGYEVMEERARFTVYKLRVENPLTNDCWLVLRRYTDFVRLNTKLKQAFPHVTLMLPRKKIFGDNFNSVFLDNRVQGLQMFVNSVMAKENLRKCKMVREFFCLDEPPSYSESMEECRAIFEAQEETIAHLKLQINSKNDLILSLQQRLREEIAEKEQLKEVVSNVTPNNSN